MDGRTDGRTDKRTKQTGEIAGPIQQNRRVQKNLMAPFIDRDAFNCLKATSLLRVEETVYF